MKLAREGEETRVESHQVAFVFGDGSGEIIKPDFLADPTQGLKGMDVAAGEGLEALTVRELEIHFPAVGFDQTEGVELARRAVIRESVKVAPIDIAAFARGRLYPDIGTASHGVPAHRVQIVFHNRDAALVTELAQSLCDDRRGGGRIFFEQLGNGRFEWIEFAGAITMAGRWRWGRQVLGQRAAANVQVTGDFAQRPLLGPVEAVNGADLFRCEHRQIRLYRRLPVAHQNDVLFKIRSGPAERRHVIEK